ncbi:MAG: DNA internalization-related competence protein ComEC/Rec2 [Candidatus Izemoplasmatales bacterium]|nr:DNA internalization-related competence protein ComEC/Rec2 [Candidatus Izemoplasmatales bacterium]
MRLRSATGKFIHVALGATLFLLAQESPFIMLFLLADLGYLFFRQRLLFWLACFTILLIGGRLIFLKRPKQLPEKLDATLTVVEIKDRYCVGKNSQGRYRLYFSNTPELRIGSVLKIKGQLFFPDIKLNPHNYNFQSTCNAERIVGFIQVTECQVTKTRFHLGILSFLAKRVVIDHFHPDTSPWILCLVFGDDSKVDPEDISRFRHLGISHLFAISGMHIGLIVLFLDQFLSRLYFRKKTHHLLIGLFLLLYNLMTGFLVSVFRASMQTAAFFLINDNQSRLSRLDIISLIFLGLLIWNPFLSTQLGFQLSFLVSFCLLLARPYLKAGSKFVSLIQLTFIANLFALPIILETNKGIGLLTIVANIVFMELIGIILLPGAFLTLFFPVLDWVFRFIVTGFLEITQFFASMELWVDFNYPAMWMKVLHWLLACSLCWSIRQPKRLLVIGEIWILLLSMAWFRLPISTKITMLAVGCGDAMVITKGQRAILIDTGSSDEYDTVLNYLRGENIRSLDLVIITHWHEDHMGELADLTLKIPIKEVISGSNENPAGIDPIKIVRTGDTLWWGDLEFEILSAFRNDPEENNNSLVISFVIDEDRWLLLGDAEKEVEQELLKNEGLVADVVKVGHHGSNTSSTPDFIQKLQASYALISVGKNSYGFPNSQVVNQWKKEGAKVYQTDLDGAIMFTYGCFFRPWITTKSKNWIQRLTDYFIDVFELGTHY